VDSLLETWESYTGFTYKHQFPPTLSEKVKSRLYFLASQTRWDWAKYVETVLPSGGPLLGKVMSHPITQPDLPVILRVIEGLSMDGSPPFVQMTAFRTACFQSFPVTHVQRMTLSQVRKRETARPHHKFVSAKSTIDTNALHKISTTHTPRNSISNRIGTCIIFQFFSSSERPPLIRTGFPRSSSCTWRPTKPQRSGRRPGSTWWASYPYRLFAMWKPLWPRIRLPTRR